MANVTFHRSSKKQEIVKAYLVEQGMRTADEMASYKGVILGDDDTVILTRAEVYATFGGRVKLVDRYAEINVKISL